MQCIWKGRGQVWVGLGMHWWYSVTWSWPCGGRKQQIVLGERSKIFSFCQMEPHVSQGVVIWYVWFAVGSKVRNLRIRKGMAGIFLSLEITLGLVQLVQFSCSVMSDSLQPHGLQHARPPCLSPALGVYSNSCPLSRWCHPAISSCVFPFSSCPQSFTASASFPMSQLFASGGRTIGVSASTSVLPRNIQDWSPLGWTGWISLQSKGLSRVFSKTTIQQHQFFGTQLSLQFNSHIHTWPLEKP